MDQIGPKAYKANEEKQNTTGTLRTLIKPPKSTRVRAKTCHVCAGGMAVVTQVIEMLLVRALLVGAI